MTIKTATCLYLLAFVIPLVSEVAPSLPNSELASLRSTLERELRELQGATFEFPENSSGKTLLMRYRTREYQVYASNRAGRLSKELTSSEGPDDDAILLRIYVQTIGEVNQAVVPQTIQEPYWSTFVNVYPLRGLKEQVYMALSSRGRTDKELIKKITKLIASHAAPEKVDRLPPSPERRTGRRIKRADNDESTFGKQLFGNVTSVYFSGPSMPANSDGSFGGLVDDQDSANITIYERFVVRKVVAPDGTVTRTVEPYDKLGRFEQRCEPSNAAKLTDDDEAVPRTEGP